MGILTPEGRYISLRNTFINVEQAKTYDMQKNKQFTQPGVYNVSTDYNVYASQKAANNDKKPVETKFINCITQQDKISGTNIHQILYDKLKELYPGSIDL